MTFAIGSLVRARGREWVVLPESSEELLMLRPLGGTADEETGIYLPLETVVPAQFDLPNPAQVGDYRSSRLLRDAVRLGFRSSAGPFRSFGRLAVEPRPYQLVPLLMALKLDPVRLLIADDVGIGKTVEAGLIARELLDRGEVTRLAVLCPPQLAEQWQGELRDKFNLEAELVLPGTAARLERGLGLGQSLFDVYPFVIVSTDFIKSDRRRNEFLRTCPELVIVDEAHTCAYGFGDRGGHHQRYELLVGLAERADRHLILVTATPHSGKEEAFRSLLRLLDPDFADLPAELSGAAHERDRRRLAAHLVQRRRADIEHFMQADTPFPRREEAEETYKLSPDYKRLFERVLVYARESVRDATGGQFHQRVRWWSALALLRSLASSPAAAAATLRNRAATATADSVAAVDEIGQRTVLDLVEADSAEGSDVVPGMDAGEPGADGEAGGENLSRRRLLDMAREAEALMGSGAGDEKLRKAEKLIHTLVKDGFHPIVFCRFIPTAEYVADALRKALPKGVEVAAVTGLLPPDEREARVAELAQSEKRVLVCTDCLSEGINLQASFDAVMHYDLSWNPTRHEQREGRVDRYGQPQPAVRTLLYYGVDNQIDGVVLDVLLRKHRTIRSSLGISVPVPADTTQVLEAVFEGLLLREQGGATAQLLPGFEAFMKPKKDELFGQWEAATDREKRSRTMFAQEGIKVDEVARELNAAQAAVGSGVDVAGFAAEVVRAAGGVVEPQATRGATAPTLWGGVAQAKPPAGGRFDFTETPLALRDLLRDHLDGYGRLEARFELPLGPGQVYLTRTHPVVEGLATYVMDTALDPLGQGLGRRCGAIRTRQVQKRTTVLLVRARYHLIRTSAAGETPLLAEDCLTLAFAGAPDQAEWLEDAAAVEALLTATPDGNIAPEQATNFVQRVIDGFDQLRPRLDATVIERGEALLEAHRRVRSAARMTGVQHRVEPQVPADVLGVYVYLPAVSL